MKCLVALACVLLYAEPCIGTPAATESEATTPAIAESEATTPATVESEATTPATTASETTDDVTKAPENKIDVSTAGNTSGPVPEDCVRCICESMTGCELDRCCVGDICGPFTITELYWIDADRPTLPGDDPFADSAFQNCASDYECASRTVQAYMTRYKKDCNGDGAIDCRDFAAIHKHGPGGCESNSAIGDLAQSCLASASAG